MKPEQRDAAHLWDMVDAADGVQACVEGVSYSQFKQDRVRVLALERSLEILGEAARRVSRPYQEAHPEIQWGRMIGQRNVIAHRYGEIDHLRLYEAAVNSLPGDRKTIQRLIEEMGE